MGHGSYSTTDREIRSFTAGYTTKSRDEIFTQQREKRVHAQMSPMGVTVRECRDNDDHPATVPVQLYLDVTGSMGHIPHQLIKSGLPTLVGRLIQNGFPDVALMFGAIGDHECDAYPLQVGQFESSDEALDMWLTRTYLEGGGGGNAGESYALAWYFAANHVVTDAFEKRGQKGFVFTIGDEPFLKTYPLNALKEILGSSCNVECSKRAEELLAEAMVQNEVYHISLLHGYRNTAPAWKQLLGDHLIEVKDYTEIPEVISNIMIKQGIKTVSNEQHVETPVATFKEPEVIL